MNMFRHDDPGIKFEVKPLAGQVELIDERLLDFVVIKKRQSSVARKGEVSCVVGCFVSFEFPPEGRHGVNHAHFALRVKVWHPATLHPPYEKPMLLASLYPGSSIATIGKYEIVFSISLVRLSATSIY